MYGARKAATVADKEESGTWGSSNRPIKREGDLIQNSHSEEWEG